MDTSEKYIKMCREGFKDLGVPQIYYGTIMYPILWATKNLMGEFVLLRQGIQPTSGKWWPIYRQDQLQEMANTKWPWPMYLFRFYEFIQQEYLYNAEEWKPIADYSMEQLWLAFVMKEKFGKTWDDEKGEMIS